MFLFLTAFSEGALAESGPRIYCNNPNRSFGKIRLGENAKARFTIENRGDQLLQLSDILADCGCTKIDVLAKLCDIAPGAKLEIEVTFISTDQGLGEKVKTVRIFSNDFQNNPYLLTLKGTVVDPAGKTTAVSNSTGLPENNGAGNGSRNESAAGVKAKSNRPLEVHYFYADDCRECIRLNAETLAPLSKELGNSVRFIYHNIKATGTDQTFLRFQKAYRKKIKGFPVAFIGGTVLAGEVEIKWEIRSIIDDYLANPLKLKKETPEISGEQTVLSDFAAFWFKKYGYWSVVIAGLVDGINPCAFATLIFFLSFLIAGKYTRKVLLIIGLTFLIVSFLTYTLLGFGVFQFLKQLSVFQWLSRLIEAGMIGLVFILGVLSIRDYILIRRGRGTREISLQLPFKAKQYLHQIIRDRFQGPKEARSGQVKPRALPLIVLAAATAFLVTLTESVCTGQIYLPTLVLISRADPADLRAFWLIVLYNICFVLPLGLVFGLAMVSVSVPAIADFYKKYLGPVKLLTALFFLALGLSLAYFMFPR